MKEEEKKKKYVELHILQQQLQQLQQQIVSLQQQVHELGSLSESLEEIKGVEKGTEILAPLGSGIFIKTKLEDSGEVVMNVGAKTAVVKNIEEAKKLVDEQIDEIRDVIAKMEHEMEKALVYANKVQEEVGK